MANLLSLTQTSSLLGREMHTSIDKRMPAQTITVDEIVSLDFGYITAKCRKYSCCDTPSFDFHTLSITGSILLVYMEYIFAVSESSQLLYS